MPADYRFISTELASGDKIAELPLSGVEWGRRLNDSAPFRATLHLRPEFDEFHRNLNALYLQATEEAATCIYVVRNNTPVGAYIVWSQNYDSTTNNLTIGGSELFSYMKRRVVESRVAGDDLEDKVVLDGQPMYDTVRDLIQGINDIQLTMDVTAGGPALPTKVAAVPGGAPEIPGSSYRGTDTKWVGDLIMEWSSQDDGFDFRIDLVRDSGVFQRKFVLRSSMGDQVTDFIAKYGTNVKGFKVNRRGDTRANDVIVVGGASIPQLGKRYFGRETNLSFLPPMQNVYQLNEETSSARLDAYALSAYDAMNDSEVIEVEVMENGIDAAIGTLSPGDDFRFIVPRESDPRYPDGLDTTVKTLGYDVHVPDTGGREIVKFQLEDQGF